MKLNPEFQRQLWLGCTMGTVLWTLGLCALLLVVPGLVMGSRLVPVTAVPAMWAAAIGYGGLLAASSLTQELRHNTWDWQRLSALTPWQMAWGKWLGSTAPAWLCVACFATGGLLAQTMAWPNMAYTSMTLAGIAQAVLWGLVVQVWVMNGVLLGWSSTGRWGWQRAVLLPVLLVWLMPGRMLRSLWERVSGEDGSVAWWGWELGATQASVVLGGGLLVLGALALWRQMAQRLDVANLPWAWPLGLVGMAVLLAGWFPVGVGATLSWVSCVALLATAYIALYAMPDGLRQWRQVQWHVARQQWRGALQALPLWPVSWVLGVVAAVAWMWVWPGQASRAPVATAGLVLMFALQLLRDALILTGISLLGTRLRAPVAVFALAWVVINVLLPLLAIGLFDKGHAQWLVTGLQPLVGYAIQGGSQAVGWYLAAMGGHVALALAWCCWVFVRQIVRR